MRAIVLLANGFEEIEAITVIDILRRADIEVTIAGVSGIRAIGSHGIQVECDSPLEACDFDAADAIVLPGGPGARVLRESMRVRESVMRVAARGKIVAAVCAAPTVLEACGLLAGKHATSHPDHAEEMRSCIYEERAVVEDGQFITSRGAGTTIEFAAAIVQRLAGEDVANHILARIQYRTAT